MAEGACLHAEEIRRSGLDWGIVRALRLTNGPPTGTYCEGSLQWGPFGKIARADVVDFMLREATPGGQQWHQQAPMVAY